jgi:hypothetical protein
MKHVIRKQLITLQLAAEQDAFAVQQKAKEYFYDQIAPALEKVLDELSLPGETISIDRIEIDLGDLGWKNNTLIADNEHIYRALKQSFSDKLSAEGRLKKNNVHPVIIRSRSAHACEQWLYYMENGVLPWALQSTHEEWLEQVIHELAIDHGLIEKTKDRIRHHRGFLARVVRDHTEKYLQMLAEVITAKPQAALTDLIDASVKQRDLLPQAYPLFKHQLWSAALLQFAEGKTSWQPEEAPLPLTGTRKSAELAVNSSPSPLQEGIFCSLAGVVLLHPFFKHLFTHLGLLEKGSFIHEAAKGKAVLLIYYIATGQTTAKDHELVVAKTLCGMPLQEVPEEAACQLTSAEKQEALNMMQAAIAQWTILQHTSADGLRDGFLRREGKLLQEQNTILFRMETSGIDVLLDHLPWNLSMIKFPWLDQLIRVEWR